MKLTHTARGLTSLLFALHVLQGQAAEFRRLDGIHRIAKAQITQPAELKPRGNDICQTGMKQCPGSLGGGCCPDGYDCAQKSCYATTKGPSTCGTKVGWHACDAVYGGGCCPDGFLCNRGDCLPASGSTYTYDCPASQYLCPSSLGYGCCPNGMGCGANQCYSTVPSTKTTTVTITTTNSGKETVFTSTAVTVVAPTTPTASPTADTGDGDDDTVFKFFPSSLPQSPPSSNSTDQDSQRGLSGGQLGGIVAGAGAFLLIMLLAAYIIIRHLNKVVAAVGTPNQPHSLKHHGQMRQYRRESGTNLLGVSSSSVVSSPSSSRRQSSTTSSLDPSSSNTQSSFVGGFRWFRNRSTGNSSVSSNSGLSGFLNRLFGARIWGSSHIDRRLSLNHEELSPPRRSVYAQYSTTTSPSSNDAESVSSPSELEARAFLVELPGSASRPGSGRGDGARPSRNDTCSPAKPATIYQHRQTGSQDSGLQEMAKTYFLPVAVEEIPNSRGEMKNETPSKKPFRFGVTSWFDSGSSNSSSV